MPRRPEAALITGVAIAWALCGIVPTVAIWAGCRYALGPRFWGMPTGPWVPPVGLLALTGALGPIVWPMIVVAAVR